MSFAIFRRNLITSNLWIIIILPLSLNWTISSFVWTLTIVNIDHFKLNYLSGSLMVLNYYELKSLINLER
jgi:hypothetical protein